MLTWVPFVNLSNGDKENFCQIIWGAIIFDECHRSSAAVTPVKHGRDIKQVTGILIIQKKLKK